MRRIVSLCLFASLLFCAAFPAAAHSIDYIATSISPAATFAGTSGNVNVTNPVHYGDAIAFTLTFSAVSQGKTTNFGSGLLVTFGATTNSHPDGFVGSVAVNGLQSCTFISASTTCVNNVTITAPDMAGAYTVKILPTSGTGSSGLSSGGGIAINFTVAPPSDPSITQVPTYLAVSLGDDCLVLHAPTVAISATLTPLTADLYGKTITFTVDGNSAGTGSVDGNGVATVTFNSGLLAVGDHTVAANFAGATVGNKLYLASAGSATLGIQYTFLGFQQPINADGSSIFNGKVIPIKISITDYALQPVVDAVANVFFAKITNGIAGKDQEAVSVGNASGDTGNTMRYDPIANQYVFNWDNSLQPNGTYQIHVGLGEGSCAEPHTVIVSLGKKK